MATRTTKTSRSKRVTTAKKKSSITLKGTKARKTSTARKTSASRKASSRTLSRTTSKRSKSKARTTSLSNNSCACPSCGTEFNFKNQSRGTRSSKQGRSSKVSGNRGFAPQSNWGNEGMYSNRGRTLGSGQGNISRNNQRNFPIFQAFEEDFAYAPRANRSRSLARSRR